MKKILAYTTLLFVSAISAQDFQGVAYYSSKTQMGEFNFESKDMSPEMQKKMQENFKKAFEKEFVLHFTKTESIYEEEVKLETKNPSSGFQIDMVSSSGNSPSKLYKNLKDKLFLKEDDVFGKEFLIKDSLQNYNWELLNESKKIGNYTCMKAQIVIPVTEEDMAAYEQNKKEREQGKTQLFTINKPEERIIEAWYTMEIPVSNGPKKYWGLPGLILELHEGNTSFLCTKVVLNPKEKTTIKKPKKGKVVTQEEFDKITEEKLKSMMDENGAIHINAIRRN